MNKYKLKDKVYLRSHARAGAIKSFEILGILELLDGRTLYTNVNAQSYGFEFVEEEELISKEEALKMISNYYDDLKAEIIGGVK